MRRLSAAKTATGATTCVQVFYHRYRYNEVDIEPMATLSRELGFEFASVLAYLTPVEKIIEIAEGRESSEDKQMLSKLVVPLHKAFEITSKANKMSCGLVEDIITIDFDGNAMLCCGSSMVKMNRIGKFLDVKLDEIQRLRRNMSLCNKCLKLGIPDYFAGNFAQQAQ
jgi:hypothetical protein